MDAKIRKITEVFGLSANPDNDDAPSFPELLQNIADLQKMASDCRGDIDAQTVSSPRRGIRSSPVPILLRIYALGLNSSQRCLRFHFASPASTSWMPCLGS